MAAVTISASMAPKKSASKAADTTANLVFEDILFSKKILSGSIDAPLRVKRHPNVTV